MIARHVPQGTEGEFAGARYDVKGTLPAILAKRAINRGIEFDGDVAGRALPLFHHAEPARQSGREDLPAGEEHRGCSRSSARR